MARFVPRQRKHKARQREQDTSNSNQEVIVPLSKAELEANRQKLREELRAQHPSISSKKQKRLDKYTENKLKKDETLSLLRKLEQEKEKFDASVSLQSSKHLGKRTFNEFMSGHGPRDQSQDTRTSKSGTQDESDLESEDSFETEHMGGAVVAGRQIEDHGHKSEPPAVQGSGLAQPLNLDENGLPIINTRTSKKKKSTYETTEELPWEGFDSDSSRGDGDSDDEEKEDNDEIGVERRINSVSEDSSRTSLSEIEYSGSDDDAQSDTSQSPSRERLKPRNSAFKAWATQQLNQSIGHVPSYLNDTPQSLPNPIPAPRQSEVVEVPTATLPSEQREAVPNRKAFNVHVDRPEGVQRSRSELPILQREQEIMEAVHNNVVVIIKGDTGSGKTTQIPQFLFEAGYGSPNGPTPGMIGITQPRRVAAVSMAKRVGEELGQHGDKVSYQIRFDSTVSPNTAIKFMTDGILLRELSQDLLLKRYSVIVIDEAHERSVNTDLLIGMLSKIVPARMRKNKFNPNPTPLKLIIMSATLNIQDVLHDKIFPTGSKPPIVETEGRQHRVTTHFALRSRPDYVEEVIEKVRRAHRKLPRGGILVFLTGQNEIRLVSDRLRKLLFSGDAGSTMAARVHMAASEVPFEAEDLEVGNPSVVFDDHDDFDIDILTTQSDDEAEAHEFDVSDDESETGGHSGRGGFSEATQPAGQSEKSAKEPYSSVLILPLYSQLPTKEQLKVFDPPPPGSRMIVLATNVAETSLTIPGIRYVFDSGRSKERRYNLETGVHRFEIDYISKASAQQRAGRAGRTGPGHCWRLYTSAVYEQFFPDHAEPEILRAPAESIALQLKGFSYPKPIIEFPFPTPPPAHSLNKAERLLKNLGALTANGEITDLGKQLSIYPLSPRLGKILVGGMKNMTLLGSVVALVAALATSEVFINETQLDMTPQGPRDGEVYTRDDQQDDDAREKRRQEYGRARATLSKQDKASDVMKLLTAVLMYGEAADKEQFCQDLFLRAKAMSETQQLRQQLETIVRANHPQTMGEISGWPNSSKLSSKHIKQLNVLAASGYLDQIAIRADMSPHPPALTSKPKRAIDVPYLPLFPLTDRPSALMEEKAVFIHPSSVLSRLPAKELPQYIVYSHLQQAQAHTVGSDRIPKTRMFPLTPVDATPLAELVRETALIQYGKPVPKTKVEDVPGTPKRRECWVLTEVRAGPAGSYGWPLPPTKVRQVMDTKSHSGWRVEQVLS